MLALKENAGSSTGSGKQGNSGDWLANERWSRNGSSLLGLVLDSKKGAGVEAVGAFAYTSNTKLRVTTRTDIYGPTVGKFSIDDDDGVNDVGEEGAGTDGSLKNTLYPHQNTESNNEEAGEEDG